MSSVKLQTTSLVHKFTLFPLLLLLSILIKSLSPHSYLHSLHSDLLKDSKIRQKYLLLITNSFVMDHPHLRWCPKPGCSNALLTAGTDLTPVTCTCGHAFWWGEWGGQRGWQWESGIIKCISERAENRWIKVLDTIMGVVYHDGCGLLNYLAKPFSSPGC